MMTTTNPATLPQLMPVALPLGLAPMRALRLAPTEAA